MNELFSTFLLDLIAKNAHFVYLKTTPKGNFALAEIYPEFFFHSWSGSSRESKYVSLQ